ncbi:MAG TPA: hypothetical protein PLV92_30815, partial [Pirellulaceae bacterium]|nr:hypothetical protein [Pirellulaceae bacterium]
SSSDSPAEAVQEKAERRRRLREVVRWPVTEKSTAAFRAESVETASAAGTQAAFWRLHIGGQWTVPAVELSRADSRGTVILIGDAGRASLAAAAQQALDGGRRVVAIDPLYWGESGIAQRGYLFMLLVQTVGQRPVGIQAAQISETARWLAGRDLGPIDVVAHGPRASLAASIAQTLDANEDGSDRVSPQIAVVKTHDAWNSLSDVIDRDLSYEQAPEAFCFGLLTEWNGPGPRSGQ